ASPVSGSIGYGSPVSGSVLSGSPVTGFTPDFSSSPSVESSFCPGISAAGVAPAPPGDPMPPPLPVPPPTEPGPEPPPGPPGTLALLTPLPESSPDSPLDSSDFSNGGGSSSLLNDWLSFE